MDVVVFDIDSSNNYVFLKIKPEESFVLFCQMIIYNQYTLNIHDSFLKHQTLTTSLCSKTEILVEPRLTRVVLNASVCVVSGQRERLYDGMLKLLYF